MAPTESNVTVYAARRVHAMDDAGTTGTALAVRDGRVLGVGALDELTRLNGAAVDYRFAEKVLLPGFVEAHCHVFEGGFWQFTYCGFFGRTDPDGRFWPGCTSLEAVIERLRDVERELEDPHEPLLAWGLDPIYFAGDRLTRFDLDAVSETRPVLVMHASIHLATINTALMDAEGIGPDTTMEGVPKDADGMPIGELQEPAAMALAGSATRRMFSQMSNEQAIWNYARLARNAGVTTLAELGSTSIVHERVVDRWETATSDPGFPARVSIFHRPRGVGMIDDDLEVLRTMSARSTDMLRFGHVKFVLDGSIQGFTARLNPPGYLDGRPNGIWVMAPDEVAPILEALHRNDVLVHAHCNGDQAVDVFLDAADRAIAAHPRSDHRHTIQHCQLTTDAQYERMAALGLSANLFANHTFYWGDQHVSTTVGADRAARMNAAATARRLGVQLSMHSDAAVTPIGSLHVAWCAVNRLTATGAVLGPDERISVDDALRAVTVGAAFQLKMDHEVGSLGPGMRADVAILDDDPFDVDPAELRDVPVWGTMVGGVVHRGE